MKKLASRKDSRIVDLLIEYGPEGYGTYALLVEYLKERKAFRSVADIRRIAYELHANEEILRAIIEDFNLFEVVDGVIVNKAAERKAAVAEPSENSELSEVSDNSEHSELAESSPQPELPIAEARSASAKRRARRKRIREYWSQ